MSKPLPKMAAPAQLAGMNSETARNAVTKALKVAALAAKFTPTSIDDAAVGMLQTLVANDDAWAIVAEIFNLTTAPGF